MQGMGDVPRRRLLDPGELARLHAAAVAVLGSQDDVVAAYLYGSAARGEAAADLDIAVLFRDAPVSGRLEQLAGELQRQGAPDGPEIDLRPLNGTAPRFRITVVREGRLLVERDRAARLEHEARAMSVWLDFRPTWERMRQRMLARWAHG